MIYEKGYFISEQELEVMLNAEADTRKFRLGLLALRTDLEKQMEKKGEPATVVEDKRGLRILTDAEAVAYHRQMFAGGIKRLYRHQKKTSQIDKNNLTNEQKKQYEDETLRQSRVLGGIDDVMGKDVNLFAPYRREERYIPDELAEVF